MFFVPNYVVVIDLSALKPLLLHSTAFILKGVTFKCHIYEFKADLMLVQEWIITDNTSLYCHGQALFA